VSYRNSAIKSIQTVAISLSSVTSNTATLGTTVDKNYSIIMLTGYSTDSSANDSAIDACSVALTNGTTVTARVNTVNGSTRVVYATVIEFFPHAMKQPVQHFSFTAASAALVTAVGAKAAVFSGGFTSPAGGTDNTIVGGLDLTSTTTVTRRGTGASGTVYGCVADFK
jgi:hypothetical protein